MRLCPKCGSIAYYDSYFTAFMCNTCEYRWREDKKPDVIKTRNGLTIKRRVLQANGK